MKKEILKAYDSDYKIEYYNPKKGRKKEEDTPLPGLGASKGDQNDSIFQKLQTFYNGPFFDFFYSIGVLLLLIRVRKDATPDFLAMATNMDFEEANFVWIMFLWLTYKCSLKIDQNQI